VAKERLRDSIDDGLFRYMFRWNLRPADIGPMILGGLIFLVTLYLAVELASIPASFDKIFGLYVNIGGVLVGLAGLVGVFALESARSGISGTDRAIEDIETKLVELKVEAEIQKRSDALNGNTGPLTDRKAKLEEERSKIQETKKETLLNFFGAIVLLIAAIMCGVLGTALSSSPTSSQILDVAGIPATPLQILVAGGTCFTFIGIVLICFVVDSVS